MMQVEQETAGVPKFRRSARKLLVVLVVLAATLSGCQSQQQAPAPEPRVVEVQVPVAVPCKIAPVAHPAFAVDSLPLGAAIDEQMRALRAERKQRQGYEARLEAAVQACR